MDILRTPEERFANLADFAFAPHYAQITDRDGGELRVHYLDEGPRDGTPVLLMHGEPSWSYLYRHIIPRLISAGHRALAPDLIGFGRSDKPAKREDYSYERHVDWMADWLTQTGATSIVMFCQDWGGLIGLRLLARFPDRFAGVIVSNTGLPTGQSPGPGFAQWLQLSQSIPEFPVGRLLDMATSRELSEAERDAYDAPFPDESFKEGARQFPTLVPISPTHASVAENIAAWKVLEAWEKPLLTAFSDNDPVTKGGEAIFQAKVPGAKTQNHVILHGGHFVQEDQPQEIAMLIDKMIKG